MKIYSNRIDHQCLCLVHYRFFKNNDRISQLLTFSEISPSSFVDFLTPPAHSPKIQRLNLVAPVNYNNSILCLLQSFLMLPIKHL